MTDNIDTTKASGTPGKDDHPPSPQPLMKRNWTMAIVSSYDWESDTWTHNGDNPAHTAWRAAVAEIATKANETLPECTGRVHPAVKIALAGDVELQADGTAR